MKRLVVTLFPIITKYTFVLYPKVFSSIETRGKLESWELTVNAGAC